MIARLPEMHRQLRELAAKVDAVTPQSSPRSSPKPTRLGIGATRARPRRSARKMIRSMNDQVQVRCGVCLSKCRSDRRERHLPAAKRTIRTLEPPTKPIGLLAGSGRFPILFAEAAQRQGLRVACVGIKYEEPDELRPLCATFQMVGVAKLGRMIRTFRRQGCQSDRHGRQGDEERHVHPLEDGPASPRPADAPMWYRRNSRRQSRRQHPARGDRRVRAGWDDVRLGPGLLPGVARERRNSHPPRPTRASGKTWSSAGPWPRRWAGSTSASRWPIKEKATLAVEAIEGTDRCIERAGQLCRAGGWTLVKVAKPQQDMRFDVPTIGVSTIENLHKARANVLAIEAGKTIVLDQAEVVALADRYGLSIVAIR